MVEADHDDKHGRVAFHTKHGADPAPAFLIVNVTDHGDFTITDYAAGDVGLRVFRQKKDKP